MCMLRTEDFGFYAKYFDFYTQKAQPILLTDIFFSNRFVWITSILLKDMCSENFTREEGKNPSLLQIKTEHILIYSFTL